MRLYTHTHTHTHTHGILEKIKKLFKKIILREKYNSDTYIRFLRNKGVTIGKNCTIYVPSKTIIDTTSPYMLDIGNNVKITQGAIILTHDFSWSVTNNIDGIITGSIGEVTIGNNVFIGMNAIITRNVKIGDNVIIGAGSVVTHDCENNSVYAGNPAKKIMCINEYHNKRKKLQIEDAKKVALKYYEKTGKLPDKYVLREFIYLFEDGQEINGELEQKLLMDSGHYEKCYEAFSNNKPHFKNIKEFLKFCGINVNGENNENSNDRT